MKCAVVNCLLSWQVFGSLVSHLLPARFTAYAAAVATATVAVREVVAVVDVAVDVDVDVAVAVAVAVVAAAAVSHQKQQGSSNFRAMRSSQYPDDLLYCAKRSYKALQGIVEVQPSAHDNPGIQSSTGPNPLVYLHQHVSCDACISDRQSSIDGQQLAGGASDLWFPQQDPTLRTRRVASHASNQRQSEKGMPTATAARIEPIRTGLSKLLVTQSKDSEVVHDIGYTSQGSDISRKHTFAHRVTHSHADPVRNLLSKRSDCNAECTALAVFELEN